MIPMVASSGAGAATNRAMGSVIIGGQTLALFLTLIATPVIYSWLDDLKHAGLFTRLSARFRGRSAAKSAPLSALESSPLHAHRSS
jgi:HAE1 family hydrophobic/amphiphilic exporter-1